MVSPSYPLSPPILSQPHPSTLPRHLSPRAGGPLWAGWVTGEPPRSGSVTAEAGKLPTLKVRPFWPFQVVVSGLWEEELVKKREQGSGGRSRATFSSSSCVSCGHICLEEGKPFSLQHKKGTVGQAGLQQGGQDCTGARGTVGRGEKDPQEFKETEKNGETRSQEDREDASPGDA